MAVLGRQAILQAVDDGLIAITPFNADHVGPASVDLTLGSMFRVFRKVHEVIEVCDHTDYRECTDKLEIPDGGHILIMPGGNRAEDHPRTGQARARPLRLA
ncbi:hypothetical protein [Parasynechococcus sp.]|uniref:dCTP deaminase domain-containing protein n=1 Tax=Parasynechococcus sp. TaxID=3101203 RepID=UPI0037045428